MIKDNHIEALSGIENVLNSVSTTKLPKSLKNSFEIEVKSLDELKFVLKRHSALIKIIMLDNISRPDIQKALKMLKNSRIKIELSGGINLHNFSNFQFPGIDYYSIGSLTHGYKSIDYSLEF
jgi:nicotinate-nucleotide pyrophosphorylase (carboxylating)